MLGVPTSNSRTLLRSRSLVVLCIAACPLAQASANPPPAAQYTITLNQQPVSLIPGRFTLGGAIGELETLPAPFASSQLTGQGTSLTQMQYWFRVDGPSDGLQVPIHITGRLRVRAANAVFKKGLVWGVTAQLIGIAYDGPLGPEVSQVDHESSVLDCNPLAEGDIPSDPPIASCPAIEQDQPVLLTLDTLSGADNEIVLNTAANNQESFSADFDSEVDPVISFAPGFDATGYDLALSDGVGNTAPEPDSPLLTSTAMGALLYLRRRRASRS